jgi:signal transduction histidine kinase
VVSPLDAVYDGREPGKGTHTYKLHKRSAPESSQAQESVLIDAELSANRDAGALLGVIVVFRDVTARRRSEEQQRQLQKMNALTLMAVGLGRVLAQAQKEMDDTLAELMTETRGRTLRLLGQAYARSSHQQSVVQQLISLGKADAGQPAPLDLNAAILNLQDKFRKTIGVGRSLRLELDPDTPWIHVDPLELHENLLRLATNARDAMPDGGTVEISTQAVGQGAAHSAQLAVRDSGKSIRPDAMPRVFDPFFQSRPGSLDPGFALALVYQFVVMNGATIDVDSTASDGTAYLLTSPAAENRTRAAVSVDRRTATYA